jgi:hypothetical protein
MSTIEDAANPEKERSNLWNSYTTFYKFTFLDFKQQGDCSKSYLKVR